MTESYRKYVQKYKEGFEFELVDHISTEISGIKVDIDVFEYHDGFNRREKANTSLQKGSLKYECECIEAHDWRAPFISVTHKSKTYLLFRKTLYGFTLIDPETLTEAYDYFPEKVGGGTESYIICEAENFGDLWVMNGCYWGSPYFFSIYDLSKKCFLDLSDDFTFTSGDGSIEISGDTLILHGEDEEYLPETRTYTTAELNRMIDEKGTPDLYS